MITQARTEAARFLGYEIVTLDADERYLGASNGEGRSTSGSKTNRRGCTAVFVAKSCRVFWLRDANRARRRRDRFRSLTSAHELSWTDRARAKNRSGSSGWPLAAARHGLFANAATRIFLGNVLNVGRRGGRSLESRDEIERLTSGSGRGCWKSAFG